MKRVSLYARVSSDKQEREETIDSQLAQLRDLAQKKGLTVVDRHVYLDEGYSGDLMARPGLDRLRDDVRDGLVDTALFHCPDRLARRYAYQVVVIEELERNGCEIDFVNREIARTPEDKMLLGMQGLFAEYERAKIMERTRRGRLHKLQSGVLIMPNPPYGYRWIPRQSAERGRVEVAPEQAELVRKIFGWVADGMTILAVTQRLMQSEIPAPKDGHRWGTSTIQNMLRNRAYIGEFCLNRWMAVEPQQPPQPGVYRKKRNCAQRLRPPEEWIVVPGPSIVDREDFEAAQRRLAENKRFALRRAHPENEFLLRCLLRCGCCGYSIIANWTKPRGPNGLVFRYYICLKRAQPTRYGDCVTKCSLEPMKASLLEEVVWSDLQELLSDPERIARHAGLDAESPQPLHSQMEHLNREVQACDRQVQRLLDAYQREAIDMEDLLRRRKEIDARKALLTDSLEQARRALLDDKARRAIRSHLPDLVRQVKDGLNSADFQTRQRLVRLLIERIIIQPNLDIEIHYALPGPARHAGGTPTGTPPPTPCSPGSGPVSGDFGLHSEPQFPVAARLHRGAGRGG